MGVKCPWTGLHDVSSLKIIVNDYYIDTFKCLEECHRNMVYCNYVIKLLRILKLSSYTGYVIWLGTCSRKYSGAM